MQLSRRPCARQGAAAGATARRPADVDRMAASSWPANIGRTRLPRPSLGATRIARAARSPGPAGSRRPCIVHSLLRRTSDLWNAGDVAATAARTLEGDRPHTGWRSAATPMAPATPPVAKPGEAGNHGIARPTPDADVRCGPTARPAATATEPARAGRGRQRNVRVPPSRSRVASRASRTPRRRGR